MSDPKHQNVIAVVNSNEDTVEMLRNCLQLHGFTSIVTGHIHDFKTGVEDFPGFVAQHDPAVLVYDISIPYDRNWTFLRLLLDTDAMRGRKVVLTTTNRSGSRSSSGRPRRLKSWENPTIWSASSARSRRQSGSRRAVGLPRATPARYNRGFPHLVGGRPTVGHMALNHGIGVRIPASQPAFARPSGELRLGRRLRCRRTISERSDTRRLSRRSREAAKSDVSFRGRVLD